MKDKPDSPLQERCRINYKVKRFEPRRDGSMLEEVGGKIEDEVLDKYTIE